MRQNLVYEIVLMMMICQGMSTGKGWAQEPANAKIPITSSGQSLGALRDKWNQALQEGDKSYKSGLYQSAVTSYRQAINALNTLQISLEEDCRVNHADLKPWHQSLMDLANVNRKLAMPLFKLDDQKGVEQALLAAIRYRSMAEGLSQDTAADMLTLGKFYTKFRNYPGAEKYFRLALKVRNRDYEPDSEEVQEAISAYAAMLRQNMRYDEADKLEANGKISQK